MNPAKRQRYEEYIVCEDYQFKASLATRLYDRVMGRIDFERFELLDKLEPAMDSIEDKEETANSNGETYSLTIKEMAVAGIYRVLEGNGVG